MVIKHLSVSSLNLFLTYPEAWYYKYVVGIKDDKPSQNLLVGIALHEGVAEIIQGKEYKHIVDICIKREGASLEEADRESAKKETLRLLDNYTVNGPYFTPKHIELEGEAPLIHPYSNKELRLPFKYRIDLITEDNLLVDHKTTSSKMSSQDWQYKNQGLAYSMLYKQLTGSYPDFFVENQIVKTKTPQIFQKFFSYSDTQRAQFWDLCDKVINKIEKGDWYGRGEMRTFFPNPLKHLCNN